MKILNYQTLDKGTLKASFDVNIPGWSMTIYGCKLFIKGNQKWIALPTKGVKNATGSFDYVPIIEFEKEVMNRFKNAVLKELEKEANTSQEAFF